MKNLRVDAKSKSIAVITPTVEQFVKVNEVFKKHGYPRVSPKDRFRTHGEETCARADFTSIGYGSLGLYERLGCYRIMTFEEFMAEYSLDEDKPISELFNGCDLRN